MGKSVGVEVDAGDSFAEPAENLVSEVLRRVHAFARAVDNVDKALPQLRVLTFTGTEGAEVNCGGKFLGTIEFSLEVPDAPYMDTELTCRASRRGYRSESIQINVSETEGEKFELRRRRPEPPSEPPPDPAQPEDSVPDLPDLPPLPDHPPLPPR